MQRQKGCGGPAESDEGKVTGIDHFTGCRNSSALISQLTRTASVSALRAASGGCASTRACGRSPKGEAADTRKAHLERAGLSSWCKK